MRLTSDRYIHAFIFAAAFVAPSIGTIEHSLNNKFVAIYLIIFVPLIAVLYYRASLVPRKPLSDAALTTLVVGALIFAGAVLAVVYPKTVLGLLPGSNERPIIMQGAVRELVNGRYPYYYQRYWHNPCSFFPGWLLLNVPFALSSVYYLQNLAYIGAFALAARKYLFTNEQLLGLLIMIGFFSPIIWHELVGGSDLLANIFLLVILTTLIVHLKRFSWYITILLAILAGLAFSSRPNYVFILPVLIMHIIRRVPLPRALAFASVLMVVAVGVTVPFYAYDPQAFSALHTTSYITRWENVLPHAGLIVVCLTGLTGTLLAFDGCSDEKPWQIYYHCAAILAIPVVAGIIITSLQHHNFEVGPYANHGLASMLFLVTGAWKHLVVQLTPSTETNVVKHAAVSG